MNNGENNVFPIQVSFEKLLLFLSVVIFIVLRQKEIQGKRTSPSRSIALRIIFITVNIIIIVCTAYLEACSVPSNK